MPILVWTLSIISDWKPNLNWFKRKRGNSLLFITEKLQGNPQAGFRVKKKWFVLFALLFFHFAVSFSSFYIGFILRFHVRARWLQPHNFSDSNPRGRQGLWDQWGFALISSDWLGQSDSLPPINHCGGKNCLLSLARHKSCAEVRGGVNITWSIGAKSGEGCLPGHKIRMHTLIEVSVSGCRALEITIQYLLHVKNLTNAGSRPLLVLALTGCYSKTTFQGCIN